MTEKLWDFKTVQEMGQDLIFPEFLDPLEFSGELAFGLGDQLISGFSTRKETFCAVRRRTTREDHVNFLFSVHRDLSVLQALWILQSSSFATTFNESLFFERLQGGDAERLKRLSREVKNFPHSFQKWIHQKSLRGQDLAPLLSLSENQKDFFYQLSPTFFGNEISKSEGTQILELLVDLISFGESDEELKNLAESQVDSSENFRISHLKNSLRILRYPETHERDGNVKENLKWPWPRQAQVKFQRRGDRAGYDLQMFLSQPQDLERALQGFQEVLNQWKKT